MLNEVNQRSTPAGAKVKHLAMSIAKSQLEILPTLRFVRMTPSQEKVNMDNCYIISLFEEIISVISRNSAIAYPVAVGL